MGAVVRSFVAGSVMAVAACASIAGLEDPDPSSATNITAPPSNGQTGDRATPSDTADGSATSSGGGAEVGADGGGSADTGTDVAPPPACQPPKKPTGDSCGAPAECCSNACSEDAKCRNGCKTGSGDICNPFDDECCLGLFCSPGLPPRCKKCLASGADPENNNDVKTCCSRTLDGNGKCL